MPLSDMPLEVMKDYHGKTIRPEDFDQYWDRAIAEMEALGTSYELVPAAVRASGAECFDLWFTGVGGAKVHAKYLRPAHRTGPCAAVVLFHGYRRNCGSWASLMSYVGAGFCVLGLDCRGQGGESEDVGGVAGTTFTTPFTRGLDGEPEGLLVRDLFLDTAMLARVVMDLPYVDETRVGCYGGSQGGGLSVACAALVPEIKLCAPTYPYMSDYKRVWEMDLATGAYEGIKYYFRHFDPRHEREEEIFTKLGYIDIQNLAPRIKAKVLMSTGLMDKTCPASTQFAAYNKMTCEKSMDIYPDFGHEGLKGADDRVFAFLHQL